MINYKLFLWGAFFTLLAQGGAWAQHNLQFKYPQYGPTWWGWYLLSVPLTWLFLTATKYTVEAFDGQIWANRFIGFSIGIFVYAILTYWFFGQGITTKVFVQLVLALSLILVQIFWK